MGNIMIANPPRPLVRRDAPSKTDVCLPVGKRFPYTKEQRFAFVTNPQTGGKTRRQTTQSRW